MNQLICESKVSEVKALESLSVDEYYQTLSTWMKIIDEKNKTAEKFRNSDGDESDNKQRRKLTGK